MTSNKTLRLVVAALMAAMACVATMVIKIPITATGGYINLGDCIVLLSGIVLGPVYGGIAAGLGSALADIFSGYAVFAPATFIIKALMAVITGLIIKNISKNLKNIIAKFMLAGTVSEIIMILGYFVFEALIMGYGLAAASGILGNVIQGVAGIVIATVMLPVLGKLNLSNIRADRASTERRKNKK